MSKQSALLYIHSIHFHDIVNFCLILRKNSSILLLNEVQTYWLLAFQIVRNVINHHTLLIIEAFLQKLYNLNCFTASKTIKKQILDC